jgi:hypothetical protein
VNDRPIPEQLESFQEDPSVQKYFGESYVGADEALEYLLLTDLEIDAETRKYIREEYITNPLRAPRSPESPTSKRRRQWREFATTIRRLKNLLREKGKSAGDADAMIAKALGLSSAATLRQRLERVKKNWRLDTSHIFCLKTLGNV